MTNQDLNHIFSTNYELRQAHMGHWEFEIDGKEIVCLTDEGNNRMRIISPIIQIKKVSPQELQKCMEANFHTALDVKYAISNDLLWSAFIHPLRELTAQQVKDAVSQVYYAAITFGSSYSSSNLYFRKSDDSQSMN